MVSWQKTMEHKKNEARISVKKMKAQQFER